MLCKNCNHEISDNASFCTFCGQAVVNEPEKVPQPVAAQQPTVQAQPTQRVQQPAQPTYQYQQQQVPPQGYYQQPSYPRYPVSVGGWIGRSLIPIIPIFGALIYFIMLFFWANDRTKEETFCNWAKAQLIVLLVSVILVIIPLVIMLVFVLDKL